MQWVAAMMCLLVTLGPSFAAAHGPASKPSSANSELAAFKRSIRKLYDLKEKAWKAGDAETIVTQFYAPDAVSVGEGDLDVLVGRDQLRAAYRRWVRDVPSVRIESVRAFVNGDAGWDWANFYATPRPDKVKDYPRSPVRILFLWSREHGKWVCEGDIFVDGKFKNPL